MTIYRVIWEAGSPNVADLHARNFPSWEQADAFAADLVLRSTRSPNSAGVRGISMIALAEEPKVPEPATGTKDNPLVTRIGGRTILSWRDRKPGSIPGPDPYYNDYEAIEDGHDPERDPVGLGSSHELAIKDLVLQLEEREDV